MVDLVHYAVLAWAGCPWMPIDAVWSLHCNAHQNAVRAPHSHWTGSGGSRTGMLVHSNSLWLLMLRGSRQGIFSGCAGSNACNATVAHLWAGEAAFIPLLSIGIAWGIGSTLCPTLYCCLLAPTALRIDQLPACWALGPSAMDGKQAGEVQEGSMHTCVAGHCNGYI